MSATNIDEIQTINLHFGTLNHMSTYRTIKLALTSSIYFVVLPLKMQRRLKQTKLYHTLFYFVWKETIHKPSSSCKSPFLQCACLDIGTICFVECFLFHVISFDKSLWLLWDFFNHHVVTFFESSVLKEVHVLCVISTITLQC